ncbi:phosphodiester glycosidase family protein [Streptomyces sp. NPDC055254]
MPPSPRSALPVLLAVLLAAPAAPAAPAVSAVSAAPAVSAARAAVGDGVETARTVRQVAPGVRLASYDRLETDRWLRIDELVVDLGGDAGVRAEYLRGTGAGTRPATVTTVAEAAVRHPAGSGRRVVAAVNGDFFDIRGTGAPLGPGLRAGRLLHSASAGAGAAVGFGADGSGRVLRVALTGGVTLPGGAVRPLTGYNAARPVAGGFAAYTADWSADGIQVPAGGAAAEVREGRVTAAGTVRGPVRRPRPRPGTTLLVADGRTAAELAPLRPGDAVAVEARPAVAAAATAADPVPVTAIGGREPLVVAGVPQNHDGKANNAAAPRTAVGFSRDGRRMRIVTVDGRQRDSGGLTLTGFGRLLHGLGVHEALNLDGGGSSTLLAALSGVTGLALENAPSDGRLRPVPNGLVLTAPTGSGRTAGFRVEALGGAVRLFPGLTRTLTATGHDDGLGPAAGEPVWSADTGRIGADGVLHAPPAASVTVRAARGAAYGTLRLDVLGPLARIRPAPDRIGLVAAGESAGFVLTGYDDQGAAATVEPRDVSLRFDTSQWRVTEDGRGGFTVTALVPRAVGRLRATVRATGATTELALGAGLVPLPLADLEDAAAWTGPHAAPTEGRPGRGIALALDASPSPRTTTPPASHPARPVPPAATPRGPVRAAPPAAAVRGPIRAALPASLLGPVRPARPAAAPTGGPVSVPGSAFLGPPLPAAAPTPVGRRFPGSHVPSSPPRVTALASAAPGVPGSVFLAPGSRATALRPAGCSVPASGVLSSPAPPACPVPAGPRDTGPGVIAPPLAATVLPTAPQRGPGRAVAVAPAPGSATPPRPLPVPELARALSLWVHGDGSGARAAVELADADGGAVVVRGPAADWTGWREAVLPLPPEATAPRPLSVTRLSASGGTRPGRLVLDTLTARTPPTGPAAPEATRPDPIVAAAAAVLARPWRFAVVPSPSLARAEQTRAEQTREDGADLVLTGAESAPFVHRGVRFLPLDTGRRTLAGGGVARMRALREALSAAAREPGTGALAVVQRYAPAALDGKETALRDRWLAEFRRTTGKRVAVLTIGGPRFEAGRSEGVLRLTAARDARTLVGADAFARAGRDWLSVLPGHPGRL